MLCIYFLDEDYVVKPISEQSNVLHTALYHGVLSIIFPALCLVVLDVQGRKVNPCVCHESL